MDTPKPKQKKQTPSRTKNSEGLEKRIVKDFADLEFEILDELMMKAGELDADIKLAKSSKEAKGDKPGDKHLKRKRGETKWKDPW